MAAATPAQTVGHQFVSQYYTVLAEQPHNLHRFYDERSTLAHTDEAEEGAAAVGGKGSGVASSSSSSGGTFFAQGARAIAERVASWGLRGARAEILSVDAQHSAGGGVMVQVTGTLSAVVGGGGTDDAAKANGGGASAAPPKTGPPRKFCQAFFLATQETGYFVLNDIFRYLPADKREIGGEARASAATAAAAAPPATPVSAAPDAAPEKPTASRAAAAPAANFEEKQEAAETSNKNKPPAAPLTYADRLRQGAAAAAAAGKAPAAKPSAPSPTEVASASAPPSDAATAPATPSAVPGTSASTGPSATSAAPAAAARAAAADEPSNTVLVREMPADATDESVRAAFARFGAIRHVTVKPSRGGAPSAPATSHAFVEFENPASVPQAMASPPVMSSASSAQQYQTTVVERKPLHLRAAGRDGQHHRGSGGERRGGNGGGRSAGGLGARSGGGSDRGSGGNLRGRVPREGGNGGSGGGPRASRGPSRAVADSS